MALRVALASGGRMVFKPVANHPTLDALLHRKFTSTIRVKEVASSTEKTFRWEKAGEIYEQMIKLDVAEIQILTEVVNERLGIMITEADMDRMSKPSVVNESAGNDGPKEETKTAFDLKLTGFDAKSKIKVIKEIRAITSLGLKDAKALVDGAPKVVKEGIKLEEAEDLKKKLEEIGATIEIV
uniref:Large ribosomal subunit protein bL12 C-terminal domain-containing protein n=1 Tax=Eucampia antarctica TaxID=49252 RepID=A0A7S2RW67_9STRA|mmetsp:Transcript_27665/g.26518  ORF Transcript_27665/g.26518 Transcript_27665/m.26518 type:complete len:183 (+) Transcript_27665:40-588(+)|eukprot:CAMPEP_0197835196 /NCGR_PEP_ID=MMETSP1437-20131217/25041_1 /TAXON_ID=49252 ORGANISM="Eucampia antarctica, Strain CCMP1452" /NCGR_SAMPLE_ID=MMETSP1437 /ASSEMBLY_ACC=CAM_ASM_001096 /LENGTH=182 /DNA_ID=CAMNT_0043440439 /DNA_START=40 /DNA_END=588 /DNA_ORIENTATION=-